MKIHYVVTAANRHAVHMLLAGTSGIKANDLRRMDSDQMAAALRFAVMDGRVSMQAAADAIEGRSQPQWRPPEVPSLEETASGQKATLQKLD